MIARTSLFSLCVALFATTALAIDEGHSLQLRPKSAIATAAPHASAPYVLPLGEPQHEPLFASPRDPRREQSRSSCETHSLCYDQDSGHIVYKPAREYLPSIPGLQPDGISLKRDKLVFKYTF